MKKLSQRNLNDCKLWYSEKISINKPNKSSICWKWMYTVTFNRAFRTWLRIAKIFFSNWIDIY
jgi:hypothetical protein